VAKVIAIGQPVNDAERQAIAHLRGYLPNSYTVIHNFEIARDGDKWEIDLAVLAPRAANVADAAAITFGAGNSYTITSGTVTASGTYAPGQPISFDGRWRITLHGVPQAGDAIAIGANAGGVGDNRNLLKLAQLQNAAAVDGTSLAAAYATLVARVGGEVQAAQQNDAAQRGILDSALEAESSVSGVNLDEEASRLIQYQQQYQAAAKLIATAQSLFDEILSIGR
jgi:flagellar hook-associated protein 1 FlgK